MKISQPTVLIVDDDDTLRKVLVCEFRQTGIRVDALSRGEDVEAALLARTYDVVLLDLRPAQTRDIESGKLLRITSVQLCPPSTDMKRT